MVAEALRQKPASESSSSATSSSAGTTSESAPWSTRASDAAAQATMYAAMTLPCTSFPTWACASDGSDPLYMTVSSCRLSSCMCSQLANAISNDLSPFLYPDDLDAR